MNRSWVIAALSAFVVALVLIGVFWTLVVPVAVLLGAVVVGIFGGGVYYGLVRARRSSERD